MMVNIYFGKTSDDCLIELIKGVSDVKKGHHIFLVPDRMSVLCEKKIFEVLNICSTTNIEVLTLSRLASRILKDKVALSKSASCMILQKILKENRDKLKCFNRNQDSDLAQTIYGTISQFKSCKISFDEVSVRGKNKLLQDKLDDIALIYSCYQKELSSKGLYDSFDKLNFLESELKNSEVVKTSNFYVCAFDSFTLQGYEIISAIAKGSINFSIGIPFSDSVQNEHIYNQNFRENIINILGQYKPNIYFCRESKKNQFKFLQDNLFSFKTRDLKVKQSNISLFEGKDFEEEVLSCACKIREMIASGKYKFEDFFIAVPNLESKADKIENILSKYGFRFFVDTSKAFDKSILARFIKNTFDLVQENFSMRAILPFIKNPILGLTSDAIEDFEDYSIKYSIDDKYLLNSSKIESCEFYENFNLVRNFIVTSTSEFYNEIEKSRTFNDFIESYKNFLNKINLEERLNDFISRFIDCNNLKQVRIFEQYLDILNESFESLSSILGEEECDFKLFFSTLESGFKTIKISTTPLSINAIFVGDCSISFFENRKVGFILGATEQDFPFSTMDCGIISDNDIDELSDKYKLEPSIADINKKERFKAFELILKPQEKLFLSYNYASGEKSKILEDISNMFVIEEKGGFHTLEWESYDKLDTYKKNNTLEVAKTNLVNALRGYCDGQRDLDEFDSNLYFALKDNLKENFLDNFNYKNNIKLQNDIFFTKNSVSVSQVESFMTCPFLHFVRYGLKLKEKEEGNFDNLNIGLILHEVAEELLKQNQLPLKEEELKPITLKIFDKIITRDDFESMRAGLTNKILLKNLRNEAVRFSFSLNEQARHSKFKPTYFEARFDDRKKIKSLKIKCGNKLLSLVGQVDRIDIFDKFFRIIDYKTGSCDTSLKELFFGKKVQLEAYMKVCETSLKLKPAGAYYLPVKSGFSDTKTTLQEKYQLKGKTLKDWAIMCASDDRFLYGNLKSDIVQVKFNKNDGSDFVESFYSQSASEKTFNNFSSYAIKLIEKACLDIEKCDITPSPLVLGSDDPCKNCKYSSLCRFDNAFGNVKRDITEQVKEDKFEITKNSQDDESNDKKTLSEGIKEEQK